jgi:hypothetical protein
VSSRLRLRDSRFPGSASSSADRRSRAHSHSALRGSVSVAARTRRYTPVDQPTDTQLSCAIPAMLVGHPVLTTSPVGQHEGVPVAVQHVLPFGQQMVIPPALHGCDVPGGHSLRAAPARPGRSSAISAPPAPIPVVRSIWRRDVAAPTALASPSNCSPIATSSLPRIAFHPSYPDSLRAKPGPPRLTPVFGVLAWDGPARRESRRTPRSQDAAPAMHVVALDECSGR